MRGVWRVVVWRRILLVAAVVALGVTGVSYFGEVQYALQSADWLLLSLSLSAAALARGLFAALAWGVAVRAYSGTTLGWRAILDAHYRAGVARYLPGGVWQPLSAVDRLRVAGARLSEAVAATLLDALVPVVLGLAMGIGLIHGLEVTRLGSMPWPVFGLLLIVMLYPPFMHVLLRIGARLLGRSFAPEPPSVLVVGKMLLLHGANLVLMGIQVWLILASLGAQVSPLAIIAASSLAWALGWLLFLAPAGLGVREGAFVVLVLGQVPPGLSLVAVVVARLELVLADLVALFLALAVGSRVGNQREQDQGLV